jgi:hypothetical protein
MLILGTIAARTRQYHQADVVVKPKSANRSYMTKVGERNKLSACKCLYISITKLIIRSFGQDGASDVTEAYVSDWSGECQRRRAARRWDETELKKVSFEREAELTNSC